MSTVSGSASKIAAGAIVIAVIAIALGGYSFFQASTLQQRNADLEGQLKALQQPKTQRITVIMGEGEIVAENATTGEEYIAGEFHRWEPSVIVVKKGDTVVLTVKNPRSHAHSLELTDFAVDTGRIPGRSEEPTNETARTRVVTFVANIPGVHQFKCGIEFDPATHEETNDCDPDHARMVGYVVVLE